MNNVWQQLLFEIAKRAYFFKIARLLNRNEEGVQCKAPSPRNAIPIQISFSRVANARVVQRRT